MPIIAPTSLRSAAYSSSCCRAIVLPGRETPADTLERDFSGDPPPVMTSSLEQPLPAALQEIVRRCLEKDPAARFQRP